MSDRVRLEGSVVAFVFRAHAEAGKRDHGERADQQQVGVAARCRRSRIFEGPSEAVVLGVAKGLFDAHTQRVQLDNLLGR